MDLDRSLSRLAREPAAPLDLAELALLLARDEYPDLDVEAYLGFLKSGGSKFPLPTLAAAGVDMSSPAPIERTLKLFAARVDELETLLS